MEYFIVANSFAAPFVSDQSTGYVEGLRRLVLASGLFAAIAYESADDYHRGHDPVARWLSNTARARELQLGPIEQTLKEPRAGHAEAVSG